MAITVRGLAVGTGVAVLLLGGAGAHAQPAPCPICVGGYVGPACPPIVDTDGNGPDSGDLCVAWTGFPPPNPIGYDCRNPNTGPYDNEVRMATPWDLCSEFDLSPHQYYLSGYVGGHFQWVYRFGNPGIQHFAVGALGGDGNPYSATFGEKPWDGGPPVGGSGMLGDADANGLFDHGIGSGPGVNVQIGFTCADVNGDGTCDYFSIPWAQSSLVGVVHGDGCPEGLDTGIDPQVWVSVSHTVMADNGGFITAYAIIPDFYTGEWGQAECENVPDGQPDPNLWRSPWMEPGFEPLQGGSIPALSQWGVVALMLGVAAFGWWLLRRRLLAAGRS